jgi:hypothetical protein
MNEIQSCIEQYHNTFSINANHSDIQFLIDLRTKEISIPVDEIKPWMIQFRKRKCYKIDADKFNDEYDESEKIKLNEILLNSPNDILNFYYVRDFIDYSISYIAQIAMEIYQPKYNSSPLLEFFKELFFQIIDYMYKILEPNLFDFINRYLNHFIDCLLNERSINISGVDLGTILSNKGFSALRK